MRPAALFSVAVAALASLAQANRHTKRPKEIKEGCWYECDDRCFEKTWTLLDLSIYKNCSMSAPSQFHIYKIFYELNVINVLIILIVGWCLQHNAMSRLDDCVHLNAIGGGLLG